MACTYVTLQHIPVSLLSLPKGSTQLRFLRLRQLLVLSYQFHPEAEAHDDGESACGDAYSVRVAIRRFPLVLPDVRARDIPQLGESVGQG